MAEKVVCVTGPTGCGKTTLSILLAERLHGEVVSADSMQIYRGMTIGSAAPAPEETHGIPHHMIAVADPAESWSVARYVREAVPVVDNILSRGNLPVLTGGTGLWLDSLVRGRAFAPGENGGEIRRELEKRLESGGMVPLWEELERVDPETAARLHPADVKRVLRALEVYYESGQTISSHNARTRDLPPRYNAVWLGLRFRDREDMRTQLDRRVEQMVKAGLLDEVRALVNRVPPDATALQAIGYKELVPVVRGECSLQEGLDAVKIHTHQFAKRQLTWFRRNPAIHWIEWEHERDFSRAVQISTEILMTCGVC